MGQYADIERKMNSRAKLAELLQLVDEFERLDAQIPDALRAKDHAFLERVLEAKRQVKRWLAGQKALTVGPDLKRKLKKIRDNHGYIIDRVVEWLGSVTGKTISQEDESDADIVDALFSEGTADYVDQEFFRRRNEAATIIVGQSLPEIFLEHLARLRECYSLGLFEATVIYCRALIESGCFEALKKRGRISTKEGTSDIRERSLATSMNDVKPFVCKPNWEAVHQVIKRADCLLHSKREKTHITEREAYDAIKSTYAIIEELFK